MATTTSELKSYLTGKMGGVRRLSYFKTPVYLIGLHCFKPPETWAVTFEELQEIGKKQHYHPDPKISSFNEKMANNCGVRKEGTYVPPGISRSKVPGVPKDTTMKAAREEAEEVMFTSVRAVLSEKGLKPKDVDMIVVNCSLFNPTPSLAAMIINHFKMRSDVIVYNLGGMGCSAGVISISLVNELMQCHKNCRALVVSTENITQNYYNGTNRSMSIPNHLFKVGGAAVLLSNKAKDRRKAKYKLLHTVRTHHGAQDDSYECVFQQEDNEGFVGVKLDKTLMKIAGSALTKNIEKLGTVALPLSEQLKYLWVNHIKRKRSKGPSESFKPYVPNFKKAFDHFCIHAGGRGVLDAMIENLSLTEDHLKPSRQTLWQYGNTSSSSIWYELAWMETNGRVKKNDVVWQIAFGSGFKCNSAVWKSMKNNSKVHLCWTTDPEEPLLHRSYKGSFFEDEDEATRADHEVETAEELFDSHMGCDAMKSFTKSFTKSRARRLKEDALLKKGK
ncbi:3-ketoacyl-CoA synthase [Chloropicon primus]|uniref:3-ketoacyl-CoA synthase n=1 Tax=Chloropicon primus TaxID=1764295 RepID=A0A5B8MW44_9CHLO|nr:3-ketoacyl-CoA synthase [Chloropicon primus]UPR03665.1 3-ketoacyl-CoA synthase [Chloropicon primus]|mmetsp:Transcript_9479/g.26958  ORF Transcript_9479/g.26958 Transcript_9479/m.26958 type:complete len:503 (-) Transcript_9479:110-1618(-)|eukprot:QDZ24456.1 3-ketoacyl-CoA synthase [Chloropicon primus]